MTSLATMQCRNNTADIEHLQAENESLRQQLKHCQRLATVGTMTAMIIHEFNNILTPIINYAHLAEGGDPEMVKKALTKSAEGGQRASDICGALLGLLRSEATEASEANLASVVNDSLLAMGRNLAKDGIELELSVPAKLQITTRPAELKQVLVNLLLNARSAILKKSRSGKIGISGGKKGKKLHLSVSDSGTGILPQHMARLFEPFFTTKTEDTGEKGNGLGLALCKEIITDMGGEIRVESMPGNGATFTLVLPG